MSIFERMADLLHAKTNKLLDKMEDPNETLDLSYEKMITGLQETKHHLADVVTEQKLLERQIAQIQQEADTAQDNARLALQSSREDLAKAALAQRQAALEKQVTLNKAHENISAQAKKLIDYQSTLENRIEQFRTQKDVMKSSYAAAQAQVKVTESLTGIDNRLGNVTDAMRRAEDKVNGMQAKAEAMDGLLQSGVLNDPLDHRSNVEKELQTLRSNNAVDAELEKLKAELGKS
ncbi:phage shock protein A [Rhodanobacter sp. K2T2]|uniref:PspA/IM30 family protein n=1 Tax=Rhodanobacter sp. K2T2 TaxID=2723085 RepID=UPI0015CC5201|nr:PspA/IM30 family protein [Rhodanobacter sp. K2T2]NYE27428.1 phage shock protein A [Rhodanobacter sp. K2T2]